MQGKIKISIVMLVFFCGIIEVSAHMPGASPPPKFELEPILVDDGGKIVSIAIEEIGEYHNEITKEMRIKKLKKQGKTDEEIKDYVQR